MALDSASLSDLTDSQLVALTPRRRVGNPAWRTQSLCSLVELRYRHDDMGWAEFTEAYFRDRGYSSTQLYRKHYEFLRRKRVSVNGRPRSPSIAPSVDGGSESEGTPSPSVRASSLKPTAKHLFWELKKRDASLSRLQTIARQPNHWFSPAPVQQQKQLDVPLTPDNLPTTPGEASPSPELSIEARAERIQLDLRCLVKQAQMNGSEAGRADDLERELRGLKQRLAALEGLNSLKSRVIEARGTYERFLAMKQLCVPRNLPHDSANWRVHCMADVVAAMAAEFEGIWELLEKDSA